MKGSVLLVALVAYTGVFAQKANGVAATGGVINVQEVQRIETVLAADDMQGRRAGTPGIDKAARFISDEFRKVGLQPLQGGSYLQEFTMIRPKFLGVKAEVDDKELDPNNVIVITSKKELKVNEKSGYRVQTFAAAQFSDARQFFRAARGLVTAKENTVVFVDTALQKNFARLAGLKRQLFKSEHDVIFILGNYSPKEFTVKAEHAIEEVKFANVVGVLPGKSRKAESVIFSAHYDHMGIGQPVNGDSIYNGANDDAAGTTAVIMLARHFRTLGNNERTLIFAAFTAEEIGGFGSQYFSQQLNADSVAAMFNIEMIGTESKWGRNSAYITGFDKSSMGAILQQNLRGSAFTFHPDPYPDQQLFYRSDNATLALLGVPAHTISTSKMDVEPNYHKPSDEVHTLDLENMTAIIRAIAESSRTIVSGKDTPTRVKEE